MLVLAGTGKELSAGADLGWMRAWRSTAKLNLDDARALAEMLHKLNTLPQPTIARVQGAAFGGAVGLVSCCDMAVGSSLSPVLPVRGKNRPDSRHHQPLCDGGHGCARCAGGYFTTAEVIDADTAVELGLLSELVGVDELDTAVETLVGQLLDNGPAAVRAAKKLVLDYSDAANRRGPDRGQLRADRQYSRIEEGQSGLKAFLNKQDAPGRGGPGQCLARY